MANSLSTTKTTPKPKPRFYIGLMSGTSADGIDVALVSFNETSQPTLLASYYQVYDDDIAQKITSLYNPDNNEIDRAFTLDVELAHLFAKAINTLLTQQHLSCDDIIAIGNHGQTIRHRPQAKYAFTLQIGCCQTLATLTNIRVIGQFRRKDMALGGQGAPLVPAFHEKVFSEAETDVFVVNIGGIANISFLPSNESKKTKALQTTGFDTGPGNALMDDWFVQHNPNSATKYDKNGAWAASGQVSNTLLKQLLSDEYFKLPAPKSTGREYFNLSWLTNQLALCREKYTYSLTNQDIQATLTKFTAISISDAIVKLSSRANIYLCGGGTHNKTLKDQLNQQLKEYSQNYELLLTNQKDIDGDQLEAIAFAWLAFAYDKKFLSSMSVVTGASKSCTLGSPYFP